MYLVEKFSRLLEWTTQKKLVAAGKRQAKATNRLRSAQRNLEATNTDLRTTQAGVLIQLTRLNKVGEDITSQMALNDSKNTKLKALIDDNFSD